MSRTLTALLLVTCVTARAADPPPAARTGAATLTFTDRSPLSTNAEICRRMRWNLDFKQGSESDYSLPAESFETYVPAHYTGEKPFGLLVFVNPHPSGRPPQQYLEAIDKHHLIVVGPNNVGNNRFTRGRMGLAIDAAVNMKARYNIDPARVYVSGVSGGGRVSSLLGVGFPDLFRGGIYIIGCNFYRDVQIAEQKAPDGRPAFLEKSYDPPPAELFALARKQSRHVLITADTDGNREQTWLNYQGFVRDKFEHITYYQVPGLGHQAPGGDWFDEALTFLDRIPDAQTAAATTPKPATGKPAPAAKPPASTPPAAGAATQPADRAAVATALLTRAKLYVSNHVYEQARERLKWITTQYPETPAAAEARKMLKEIDAAK